MKKPLFSITCIVLFGLLSCKKNNPSLPSTSDSTTTHTLKIDFPVGAQDTTTEIIISENTGKLLLDTIMPFNAVLNMSLPTNATLFDFTVVFYSTDTKTYDVATYKAVNPSTWGAIFPSTYTIPFPDMYSGLATGTANISYTAPPGAFNSGYMFTDALQPEGSGTISGNTANLSYPYIPGNYDYLLLPNEKLYNLYLPSGVNDNVVVSPADTVVSVNFNHPSQYTLYDCQLLGIEDTSDLSKTLLLYSHFELPSITLPADLQYPPVTLFQQYQMTSIWTIGTQETLTTYNYGDTVPRNIAFLDKTNYTITSNQGNNFSLMFNAVRPTFYIAGSQTNNVHYYIYASPDSVQLNPLAMLTGMKSKMLQGQNLATLTPSSLYIGVLQGFDYAGYFSFSSNPPPLKGKPIASSVSYGITF